MAIDEEALLDHVLTNAPEYVRSIRRSVAEIRRGDRGRPIGEVLAELDDHG